MGAADVVLFDPRRGAIGRAESSGQKDWPGARDRGLVFRGGGDCWSGGNAIPSAVYRAGCAANAWRRYRRLTMNLPLLILIGGVMHFGILLASACVPQVLDWKQELRKLDPLSRQLVWVHG